MRLKDVCSTFSPRQMVIVYLSINMFLGVLTIGLVVKMLRMERIRIP